MILHHRLALSAAALLGALSCFSLYAQSASGSRSRPNVVIAIADDLTWHDLGCYGNRDVQTPHLDQLAKEGLRFTHAFTATAMCAPTRQQLYTGLFPVRNGAYRNHSRVKKGTPSVVHHLRKLGYRVGLCGKRHIGPPDSFPFEKVTPETIGEFMSRSKDEPYCLVYASNSPHLPWTAGDASKYDAASLKLPLWVLDVPETREAFTKYYAEVTDFDREVGVCLAAVEASGTKDNTIFIATSEQGAQFPRGKWTCYDTGLRVALLVRWPGLVKPGSVSSAMVQYVDIVPTILAAAGGDPTSIKVGGRGFDGRSFLAVLKGDRTEHHDAVFGVHTTRGIINGSECYPIRSVRTRTHKLILNLRHEDEFQNVLTTGMDNSGYWQSWKRHAKTNPRAKRFVEGYRRRPAVELYDVQADPFELNNLADAPEFAEIKAQLRDRLAVWMKEQGDEGVPTEMLVSAGKKRTAPKTVKKRKRSKRSDDR